MIIKHQHEQSNSARNKNGSLPGPQNIPDRINSTSI